MTTLTTLPNEIILKTLKYLPGKDLYAVALTCRYLNSACDTELLWQGLCEPVTSHSPFSSWRELFKRRLHLWGHLQGVWYYDNNPRPNGNDNPLFPRANPVGALSYCRYNSITGNFDFHVFCIHHVCSYTLAYFNTRNV
jgi:hypothetical protein